MQAAANHFCPICGTYQNNDYILRKHLKKCQGNKNVPTKKSKWLSWKQGFSKKDKVKTGSELEQDKDYENLSDTAENPVEEREPQEYTFKGKKWQEEESPSDAARRSVLPEILVQVYHQKVHALLDTGATRTCCSEAFLKELDDVPYFSVPGPGLRVDLVVGSTKVQHVVLLRLQIAKCQEEVVPALVVPGMSRKLIIGADFLAEHGAVLDFQRGQLFIHGEREDGIAFAGV